MKRSLYRKIYANCSVYVYIHVIYLQLPPTSIFRLGLENLFFKSNIDFQELYLDDVLSIISVIDHLYLWRRSNYKKWQRSISGLRLRKTQGHELVEGRWGVDPPRERECLCKKFHSNWSSSCRSLLVWTKMGLIDRSAENDAVIPRSYAVSASDGEKLPRKW